ncbi:hypothetical protein [Magnetospirillum fulvum]|nr:hypothetical protein [Magnetospirillum fulvum]
MSLLLNTLPALMPTLPALGQVAAFLAIVAGLATIGAGLRIVTGNRDAVAAADLVVGWGLVVVLFVVGNSLLAIPLTILALLTGLAALVFAIVLIRRKAVPMGGGIVKLLVLLLPILAVTASMQASEGDDFGTWLPNLRYLVLFDHFPGPGLEPTDSQFPAYPPAGAIVAYLVSLLSGQLSETAIDRFNLILLGALALLLIRTFRDEPPGSERAVRWRDAAIALAFVTLFSPTFVPRLVLANYAECATAVSLAFAVILGLRLVQTDSRPGPALMLQATAVFAALVMTKQSTLALFGLLLIGLAMVARRTPRRLGWALTPFLVALAMLLVWKHHVMLLGGGEMPISAFDTWHWNVLPETLGSMLTVTHNKSGYFGLSALIVLVGLWTLIKGGSQPLAITQVFTILFLGFNAFLLWTYIAVFIGNEGSSAASFWRYNTQLGGVQLVTLAALLGVVWRRKAETATRNRIVAVWGTISLLVLIAGPVLGAGLLRFDIHKVKMHIAEVAPELKAMLPPGTKVWFIDPPKVGMHNQMEYNLGYGTQLADRISYYSTEEDYANFAANEISDYAYVLNSSETLETAIALTLPVGASHLIHRDQTGQWRIVKSWLFKGFVRASDLKY